MVLKMLSATEHRTLCLVNQDIRQHPFIYSKIQWTWQKDRPDSPPPIPQLLRILLSRPQLAGYITDVRLDGYTYRISRKGFRWTIPSIPIPNDELDKPIEFIRQTEVPYSNRWIQELRDGTIDAIVALLLAQLNNLKYLYLSGDFTRRTALIGMVLQSAICEPIDNGLPDFRRLQDVSFLVPQGRDEAWDQKTKNTADVLPLFYLPNVQRMSASIQNPDEFRWTTARLPNPTKLISLDLTHVREGYLGELLSVTKNLRSLRWEWYFDYGVEDRFTTPIVELTQIVAALSTVRDTLTDLTIFADCECDVHGGDAFRPAIKTEGSLHSLVNFDMLRSLQIPWAFLVGFVQDMTKRLPDVIPRNIEYLIITDDLALQNDDNMPPHWPQWEWKDYAIVDLLQSWLEDWGACTPHLRRITLLLSWIDTDMNEWSPGMRDRLRELGGRTGVALELIELDRWKNHYR
ncbi:hypothetical protein BDW75DRAFT_235618 [Aspergillus navahoensis]